MNIIIVGNVLKDVYLNLDDRTEDFETDRNQIKWLNLGFNGSKHSFFSRTSNFGGAAVSLEVLQKFGLGAAISDSKLDFNTEDSADNTASTHRYILVTDGNVTYFSPTKFAKTDFTPPSEGVDYLFIDRSANLSSEAITKILSYLELSPNTHLVLYLRDINSPELNTLAKKANLIFFENNRDISGLSDAPELAKIDLKKVVFISEDRISYLDISEPIAPNRADLSTHLSLFSIAAASILGSFILGNSVEDSLKLARLNLENSKLNATLSLAELKELMTNPPTENNLELVASNLVLPYKGILAADESGGSIHKKFEKLQIADTYENRRDYRNLFFTTEDLENYVNGVILFDETARQTADNGENFVNFLTAHHIIPGIKVDQGLEKFPDSNETFTKGLDGLSSRLNEYYSLGLRFAKWRAAFEVRCSDDKSRILTPSDEAINENCHILAEYAHACQSANIVPIVEPELVYDGDYSIDECADLTAKILDRLFQKLIDAKVNLRACILKCNMVLAGKRFESQSTPEEVGVKTAQILKDHVPEELAGVVFLSGGQTVEQSTDNLAAVIKNGPFPWPVTFSFARALQDPALYAWAGNNNHADEARAAFKERLVANQHALKQLGTEKIPSNDQG